MTRDSLRLPHIETGPLRNDDGDPARHALPEEINLDQRVEANRYLRLPTRWRNTQKRTSLILTTVLHGIALQSPLLP